MCARCNLGSLAARQVYVRALRLRANSALYGKDKRTLRTVLRVAAAALSPPDRSHSQGDVECKRRTRGSDR